MNYFNDVLTSFLGLECFSFVALAMEGQKALGFNKKKKKSFLICVPKMKKGYTGLERHESK